MEEDGPNVNWRFLEMLQAETVYGGTQLVVVGSCGLHTLHNAVKCGFTEWHMEKFLRALHTIFPNVPARREDFCNLTKSKTFALPCCGHRWIENLPVVCLTATQNIAQRSHRESSDSENRGNSLEILELVSKHDQLGRTRLEDQAKNAKYTSSLIQNEIISILAGMVRDEIIKEVKESETFSVIVDETKDVKKNGMVHESFLEFQEAERLDAAGLTETIIDCLERHGLNYKENLVGQGSDGAAVMSGKHSGVQARIRDVASHAFYVHCSAHCLNLVIVDSVESVSEAGTVFFLCWNVCMYLCQARMFMING